jgi:hypothetical protein
MPTIPLGNARSWTKVQLEIARKIRQDMGCDRECRRPPTLPTKAKASEESLNPKRSNAMAKKPNFLILWGDDIGQSNLSIYSRGVMGYRTPNIDRIGEEGVLFTDYYGGR